MTKSAIVTTTARRLGEVREYYFATKMRQIRAMEDAGIVVRNLGIGSPDLPPHPNVIKTLNEYSIDGSNHAYQSYSGVLELRVAFSDWYAKWFGVNLEANTEVLPLMGSKEGIMHIAMTFLEEGDEVLIPNPGYPAYRAVCQLTGAKVKEYNLSEENGWLPDMKALSTMDFSKVKMLWMNYPNMPTGAEASISFFKEVVALAKKHQFIIVNDNPYNFILNDNPISILSIAGAKEVALELNSLSKSHNMAGWRIGMVAGHGDFIKAILRFKSNMDSGMFKPIQMAAVEALNLGEDWYAHLNTVYKERRQIARQLLKRLGCRFSTQQSGLFVWAKIPDDVESAAALSDELLEKYHLFITPGHIFGQQGERYLRLSLCSPVEVFKEVLAVINEEV